MMLAAWVHEVDEVELGARMQALEETEKTKKQLQACQAIATRTDPGKGFAKVPAEVTDEVLQQLFSTLLSEKHKE